MTEKRNCGTCKYFQIDGMFGMWCDKNHKVYLVQDYCSDYEKEVRVNEISVDTDAKNEYPKIKLSKLIRLVVELKALALSPKSESLSREKLYNKITHIESLLVELKDINVELERDWWKE